MPTDADLVEAVRNGDREAFTRLYDRYADPVHRFCFARLRDDGDAAEALKETWLRAHRGLAGLSHPDGFRPWLFTIARHAVVDLARARGRTEQRRDWGPVGGRRQATGPHDDTDLAADGAVALLWDAAETLQPKDQELLHLHFREGMEGAELAAAMEEERGTAEVMLTRLDRRLSTTVGTWLVARRGCDACASLDELLRSWDGTHSLAARTAVTRHIERCETCRETRRLASEWEPMAAAMPSPPAPATVRIAVLAAARANGSLSGTTPHGDQRDPATIDPAAPDEDLEPVATGAPDAADVVDSSPHGRTLMAALGAAFLVAAVTAAVIAWPVLATDDDPDLVTTDVAGISATDPPTTGANPDTTAPTEPPETTEAAESTTTTTAAIGPVFFGSSEPIVFADPATTVAYTFANVGDAPMTWAATATPPFVADLAKGTLLPGTQVTLFITHGPITQDPALPVDEATGALDLVTDGGDFVIELRVDDR
jgi:RNA polymerase sigma factor (sigma-70 family)